MIEFFLMILFETLKLVQIGLVTRFFENFINSNVFLFQISLSD